MKKYKWVIILLNLVILLVFFNSSLIKKEDILEDGQLVLLELAPVDPRSLMQGDYMRLRYKISQDIETSSISKRGYCVVKLGPNGVATKQRLQDDRTPKNEDEYLIKYAVGNWDINIGAESFFFEEGQADKFDNAKYGGLKVADEGNSVLVGLYDKNLDKIQ